mgnify:CR=1 FL=1
MVRITLGVEGMKCVKCSARMDEAVRNAFPVEKVTSSHENKETVIICEEELAEEKLREVVTGAGFELLGITKEPYEKKGLFGLFKK